MNKDKHKEYQIQANLNIVVSIPITAKNLDEALDKSKELKESDFIEFLGDYLDGDFEITGIFS